MKVELLHYTPIEIALEAGLTCTNSESKMGNYNVAEFIYKLIEQDHTSVLEHINYTFHISEVSRALLQQLSRHRHISLSVQSTRWALNKTVQNDVVFSENEELILKDTSKAKILNDLKRTSDMLKAQLVAASKQGIPNDILKYYIQESTMTKLILTLNARELRHIFKLRTSPRALKEFQRLCKEIYNVLPQEHRFMYGEFFAT